MICIHDGEPYMDIIFPAHSCQKFTAPDVTVETNLQLVAVLDAMNTKLAALGGLVEALVDDRSESASKIDSGEYAIGFCFEIMRDVVVDLNERNKILFETETKTFCEQYLVAFIKFTRENGNERNEKKVVSVTSRLFLQKLTSIYFDGEDLYYSSAMTFEAVIHDRKYRGLADHTVKERGENLYVLVWEDKFDDLSEGDKLAQAIGQTGLEIEGEMRRLEEGQNPIFPAEYCGILTNGRDWFLVSCVVLNSRKYWRHSLRLSTARKESSTDTYLFYEDAIDPVANLLLYAFNCARSIHDMIKSRRLLPPSRLPPTPEERAEEDDDSGDDGDDIRKVSDALQKTGISDNTRSRTRADGKDGANSGKSDQGSGKGHCHSDVNETKFGIPSIKIMQCRGGKENTYSAKMARVEKMVNNTRSPSENDFENKMVKYTWSPSENDIENKMVKYTWSPSENDFETYEL